MAEPRLVWRMEGGQIRAYWVGGRAIFCVGETSGIQWARLLLREWSGTMGEWGRTIAAPKWSSIFPDSPQRTHKNAMCRRILLTFMFLKISSPRWSSLKIYCFIWHELCIHSTKSETHSLLPFWSPSSLIWKISQWRILKQINPYFLCNGAFVVKLTRYSCTLEEEIVCLQCKVGWFSLPLKSKD